MNFFFIFIVTCFVILKQEHVEGAKILAVFPFPGPSQYILVQPYLKALAAKGHNVTVINAFPQKQKIENFNDVTVMEVHNNYYEILEDFKMERNKFQLMSFVSQFFTNMTETVIKNPNVQQILKSEQFDLVIIEVMSTDAWSSFGRHFHAPMIGISSYGTDPMVDELMGNMCPFSYVPLLTAGFTEHMSYKERLQNVVLILLELIFVRLVHIPRHEKILHKYLPHIKEDLRDLRTNFSLMLLNQHFSLSFPRPYVPSMIEVGGFQINYEAKSLPEEMEDFINSSPEDVIYFSLGSNVKSKDFSPERLQMINDVFRSLPYKIMWKFEEANLPGKPDNVFISPWFPQPDVLAHPRVKLFISHGGLLSTTESIYHGKPLLCLPVFYDQEMNARKAQQSGFALKVDFYTLPRDEFKSNIIEIMQNPAYTENVKAISMRYHDQPLKPLDLAIYWTEYVLRHKGAKHLQSPAQKMSYIVKHSIDTVGLIIIVLLVIAVVINLIIWKIVKFIFIKKSNKLKVN